MHLARLRQEIFNIPNVLTYTRVGFIPAILWLMMHPSPLFCLYAAGLFAVASVTDVIDGYVARAYGQVSLIGKFLDPLADKIIVFSVLIYLLYLGRFSPLVLTLSLTRELAVTGLRLVAIGEGIVIAASDAAKQKTALQLVGIVGLLVHYKYPVDFFFACAEIDFHRVGMAMMYFSVCLSLYSGVLYFLGFIQGAQQKN